MIDTCVIDARRLLLSLLVACAMAAPAVAAECRDSFQRIMAGAAEEWPQAEPFQMPPYFVQDFMRAYNAEADGAPVAADAVWVVPVAAEDSATWWYFGFVDGCLSFYAELSESKGYPLIEQGHAMDRSGAETR